MDQWQDWLDWLHENQQWIFSGVGLFILGVIGTIGRWLFGRRRVQQAATSSTSSQTASNGGIATSGDISVTANHGGKAIITTGGVVVDVNELAAQLVEPYKQQLTISQQREQEYQDEIQALTEAVRALADQQDQPDAPPGIADALTQLTHRNTEAAEAIFQEVLTRKAAEGRAANIEAAEAARHLGTLAFLHDTDRALQAYRRAVDLDPDNVEGWNRLGHILLRIGELENAEAAYQKAFTLGEMAHDHSVMVSAYGNLGIVYQIRGDLEQAEAMYRKAPELFQEIGAALQVEQTEGLLDELRLSRINRENMEHV
jgi:tetratricopeptide (TPR) repeat protein